MGRTVYAEERHWNYLISLTKSNEYTAGLILGQNAGSKDYVVHLAKTPPPAGKNVVEETLMSSTINTNSTTVSKDIKSIKDMEESWVADHAKHVTRMLPGGMWVRGMFMIGPEDILNDNTNVHKLKSILLSIYKNLLSNTFLCGNNEEEHLILCLNSLTQKYVCKSINIVKDGILKPVDWKFQEKACKWQQLETSVDFNQLFHIAIDKDPETLKEQLQNILKNISETVHSAIVVTEGEVRSPDDLIESIGQKQKNKKHSKDKSSSNEKVLHVSLYIPCIETKEPNVKPTVTPCSAIMRLTGQLFARVFLHQKATIGESSTAIKQDIIRSVASRFEMHWDSLIEEENGSPEEKVTLHEPPRRVLIALPQSKVTFSDYLFPGEGPQEALISLQDLLDLEVQESRVEKDVELQIDPSEFYCQSDMDIISSDHNNIQSDSQQSKMYLIALLSAVVVLIAAVLIHYLS